jgi:hypothetical protein
MVSRLNLSSTNPSSLGSATDGGPTLVSGGARPAPIETEALWESYDAPEDLSPEQQEFSALRELELAPKGIHYRFVWLILLLVGAGSYSAYEVLVNDHNPFESMLVSLDELIKSGMGQDLAEPQTDAAVVAASVAQKGSPKNSDSGPVSERADLSVKSNTSKVYNGLPNKQPTQPATVDAAKDAPAAVSDEIVAGMNHEFVYQRFKAIQEIRKQKLIAATDLLRQGLVDEKFWNRMYSAITLADFGVPVTVAELGDAIEDTRSELVANFFRRFLKKPGAGELYIMRQMLRVADERGRLVLLQAIAASRDDLRNLYLVAATMEDSAKIKGWATTAVKGLRLPQEELQKLREQVLGVRHSL